MKKNIYLFSTSAHPDAININSLDVKPLKPSIDFSKYDYFIITSKQAVKSLQQYDKSEYLSKKALCVSVMTAKSYEEAGGGVLEIGAGYGDKLVDKIKNYPKSTKWLYLRAKAVASDFVEVCKRDGFDIDEAVVYQSVCSQEILEVKVQNDAILIFTSPSSLNCFLKTNAISPNNKVIAIGDTTAKAIPQNVRHIVSSQTSIQGCVELALDL
jgi:uroporphyrinogen-III synthase